MSEISQERLRRALRNYEKRAGDAEELVFYHRSLLGWQLGNMVVIMPWPNPEEVPIDPLVAIRDIEEAQGRER